MTANSKLNKNQKGERNSYLHTLEECFGTIASKGVYTVVKVPEFFGSKMARFSVSVCSDDEAKIRRKVGEYHALNKMFWKGEYIYLPNTISADALADAYDTLDYFGEF